MAYSSAAGRQELLEGIAAAVDELGFAVASLGEAYEQLDDATADRLEEGLFRPAQMAYGRSKRAYADFAARHSLEVRGFEAQAPDVPSTGAHGFIDEAVEAAAQADAHLATVQDSPKFLEVGDVELRAALAEVRELVGTLRPRARELVRTLGR
ncbi:MAG: hypothetical protein H0T15_04280 [Thermoleophilaceae bacterium]|nr:hypothetical protein [Thermoleophilaceae bacterium]